jgi:hypothetical protein
LVRQEVQEQCSIRGSKKIDEDYKRTKADFYRMELDKMDEYSAINRPHMKAAYFAYLQNTTGSKKALKDCVRSVEKGEGKEDGHGDNEHGAHNHQENDSEEAEEKAEEETEKVSQSEDGKSKDGKNDKQSREKGEGSTGRKAKAKNAGK